MRIKELYIENFGRLSSYRKSFGEGLNTVCLDNGTGKTTLTVFIKAMLYGLDDTKKQSLLENERKRYLPWGGGACGGWMVFSSGGKDYRVERSFGAKASEDSFAIYDIATGLPSSDFTAALGCELFDIDSDGFERTAFLSEKNLSGKNENQTVSAKLSDLVGVEGDIGEFDSAIALLEKRRKFYQKKGGAGEIRDVRERIEQLESRLKQLSACREALSADEAQIASLREKLDKARAEKERLLALRGAEERQRVTERFEAELIRMKGELSALEEKEEELLRFFSGGLPSTEDISEAEASVTEAKRLKAEAEDLRSRTCHAPVASPFAKLPDANVISEMSYLAGADRGKVSLMPKLRFLLPLGGIMIICGIILGFTNAPLFALSAVGAVAAVLGAFGFASAHASKQAKRDSLKVLKFIEEIYGEPRGTEAPLSQLITMRAELEKYLSDKAGEDAESRANIAHAEEKELRARELYEKTVKFLSLYPTVSQNPFEEIRRRLTEYRVLGESLGEKRTSAERFAAEHGISYAPLQKKQEGCGLDIAAELALADETLISLERERLLAESRVAAAIQELERYDSVEAELLELEERAKVYTENLMTINRAKELLSVAKTNMTARYLDGTRRGFAKYTELIEGQTGEFIMDTDFTVMKSDTGAARQTDAYSRATRDIYGLATRLALIDSLYEKDLPPLILDDPFLAFDDKNTERALGLLSRLGADRQILYFTCSSSRAPKR